MDDINDENDNVETLPSTRNTRKRPTKTTKPATPTLTVSDAPRRKYDVDLINRFLDLIFSTAQQDADEEILTWAVRIGKHPAYPDSEADLLDDLPRHTQPLALYYGTATCKRDPMGQLRNRQALFKRLYVIVLDDIATKIPVDKIPKALRPTYVVESSEGNYQWGYVLKKPIENLEAARALVQLVYEAGISDAGGKMPNKLVRLPEGVNGKPGAKRDFVTRLVHMDGPKWSPEDLLDAMGSDITWDDLCTDAEEQLKRTSRQKSGTSPWSPLHTHSTATNGITDPVLEWLYHEDQVCQEAENGWTTIECPWADQHSGQASVAGYSALGVGDRPETRGFHCFHGHCASRTTADFLSYVSANGGPEAAPADRVGRLISQWVYDAQAEGAWDIKTTEHPQFVTISAFRMVEPHSSKVQLADGSNKTYKDHALWTTSPGRVTVYGRAFHPNNPARLVMEEGRLKLNSFAPPAWEKVEPDQRHIKKFTSFLDYLIPTTRDREYFLNWLTAKAQNMGFRGAAILMIAKRQGTGRTTLGDMITDLFEKRNVEDVPFSEMLSDRPYNEWMESPIVITNETMAVSSGSRYKAYEHLKDMIDPPTKKVRINPKYGKQRVSTVHSSFLFFSNHEDALSVSEEDRRFYVLENAPTPETPEFFNDLNAWLDETKDGRPLWAQHVWWWLQGRSVGMTELLAPPTATETKKSMMSATVSPIEIALDAALTAATNEYVTSDRMKRALEAVGGRIGLFDTPKWELVFRRLFTDRTTGCPPSFITVVDGKRVRPRIVSKRISQATARKNSEGCLSNACKTHIRNALLEYDEQAVTEAIDVALDLADL